MDKIIFSNLNYNKGYVNPEITTNLHKSELSLKQIPSKPVQVIPVQVIPVQAKPVQAKPVQAKPVQAKPVQAKPVQAKPVQAKPVQAKPVQAKPVQAKPVQAKSASVNTINKINQKVYIVSNIKGGGSYKYIQDLIFYYKKIDFIIVMNKNDLLAYSYTPYDVVLVQQLLFMDIVPNDLLEIKDKFKIKLIICVHDFCWFQSNLDNTCAVENKVHGGYLTKVKVHKSILKLFNEATLVIYNSFFTQNEYLRYFSKHNIVMEYPNDIKPDYTTKQVPLIQQNTINISHFQGFSLYKGKEYVKLLMNKYTTYKGYKINFLIVGVNFPNYTESNWYNQLTNVHGLLHLNKYGETYSYTLTKSINSGLPILYNNIGAFKERIKPTPHYFKVTDHENEMDNLYTQFEKMLNYIIENNGLFNKQNTNNTIVGNEIYNYVFNKII
jgi:hypothetical protein